MLDFAQVVKYTDPVEKGLNMAKQRSDFKGFIDGKQKRKNNKNIGNGMILSAFLSLLLCALVFILTKDIKYSPGALEIGYFIFAVNIILGVWVKRP